MKKEFGMLFGFWAVIILGPTAGHGQTDAIETLQDRSYKAVKTYEPPSDKFIAIKMQTHQGLLRFGEIDNYFTLPDGSYVNHKSQTAFQKADKKNWEISMGRQAFYELLRFKYMSDIYKDMDRALFTKYAGSMYEKDKNSWLAQTNLLKLANAVTHVKDMPRFFCNPKLNACGYDPSGVKYFHRNVGNVSNWGGKNASEFKQLGAYTAYVNEYYSELQQWKDHFFVNDSEKGYLVVPVHLNAYDFKHKGYWLRLNAFINNGKLFRYMGLQPSNSKERKLVDARGVQILYPMSPEKAEVFSENTRILYLVFKIKVTIKGMGYNYEHLDASYTLLSPTIALYKDDSLTDKTGELSIETMTTK
ncbi:hypothetical protein WIW50_17885 [Flavobacteriaceae bacterium 3-367]